MPSCMVYLFIKYGVAKLKWWVIIAYIAVSWVVALAVSSLLYIPTYGLFINEAGFCDVLGDSKIHQSLSVFTVMMGFIHLVLTITFTVLTYCYIKKHTVEDSVDIKKAVAKTLLYLMVSAIISSMYTAPSVVPNVSSTFAGMVNVIYLLAFRYYIPQVLVNVISAITPIVTIILLKPARVAMRNACQKLYCCAKKE